MIARGLWALRQAANAQPDPKALAYSIALETLISACFFNIKPVDPAWRKEVEALRLQISQDQKLPEKLRERGSKKLTALINEPNDEKIREFLKFHVSTLEEQNSVFDDWNVLRNKASHGHKFDTKNFNEVLRRINVVLDLCYLVVLCRIGFFQENARISYSKPYARSWRIIPFDPFDPSKTALGLRVSASKSSWTPVKHRLVKKIPVDPQQTQAITLTVVPYKKKGPPFKISVLPKAVIPDAIAKVQIAADYPTILDAQQACEDIAQRALLHVTLAHFCRAPTEVSSNTAKIDLHECNGNTLD